MLFLQFEEQDPVEVAGGWHEYPNFNFLMNESEPWEGWKEVKQRLQAEGRLLIASFDSILFRLDRP
jgi:hypothetical protein